MEPAQHPDTAIADAHRRLIAERLPLFTGGWLAATAFWVVVVAGDSGARWLAGALLCAAQGALFGLAVLVARRAPPLRHLQAASVAICAGTALAGTAFCVLLHAGAAIVAMLLFAVVATSSLLFAWRAPVALLMFAATWGPWMLLEQPWPALGLTPLQCLAGAVVGGAVFATIAEAAFAGLRATVEGTTAHRRAIEALRASERRYRGLVESQQALIVRCTEHGILTFVNDAYCAKFGRTRAQLLGASFVPLVHPDDLAGVQASIARLEAPPYRDVLYNRGLTPEGPCWFEWELASVRDEHGRPIEIQAIGRDVTARKEAEDALHASLAALRASEQKLRRLAHAQTAIREAERKRLGFDLHDDVCQELVGIGILIESACYQMGADAPGAGALRRAVGYLGAVVEHLRRLARELRPLPLRDLGLEGALRALAAGVSTAATRVAVDVPVPVPRLAEETEVTFYRVAHEALTNALRHAAARTVSVGLRAHDGELRLDVQDDGRGFDLGAKRKTSIGLASMEERALARGGRLTIESAPGQGTRVTLVCALTAAESASAA